MIELKIQSHARDELISISHLIEETAGVRKWRNGVVTIFVPHTTAGVTIQENADPDVLRDVLHALNRMVEWNDPAYQHMEGNSAAHVKASLMGSSVQCLVEDGRLCLGTWQGVFFAEFDGPRSRKIWVSWAG
ncbi:MAG: secondary thiamine-phosphate synthase enzyme YjbQ [Verrucomicrobiae bacterium]|nr:secondary thiamine-phosphate synthase enzyme YjbQ [Verrucomicrobiae bacterium]